MTSSSSCLLPQFKCTLPHPSTSSSSSSSFLRNRDSVCFRAHCAVSTPPPPITSAETAVLDVEKLRLPYVEANSNSLPSYGLLTYSSPPSSSTEAKFDVTLAAKSLIEDEEAVIAAAAAEALALARAAAKLAKDAARMAGSTHSPKPESNSEVLSDGQPLQIKSAQLLEDEPFGIARTSETADTSLREGYSIQYPNSETDDLEPTSEELQLLEAELSESIAVRSTRQVERKARRARAAEKAASNVAPVKSGSNSRRRRTSVQEVDYSDPLRYLRGTTSSSKLLTASEELQLSAGIQEYEEREEPPYKAGQPQPEKQEALREEKLEEEPKEDHLIVIKLAT